MEPVQPGTGNDDGFDDGFIDDSRSKRGFRPLRASALGAAAASLETTPMQIVLAWLVQRSPNILLIPGTSSIEHLRSNLKTVMLQLQLLPEMVADLDSIGGVLRKGSGL